MFQKIYTIQKKFQESMKQQYNINYKRVMTLALVDEVLESLRELPWKPWKKQQQYNKKRYKEELADVYIFLMNLMIASNITIKDLQKEVYKKIVKNKQRQKHNY